jgi:SAM-dependent methyltransferase
MREIRNEHEQVSSRDSNDIVRNFGYRSDVFRVVLRELDALWERVKKDSECRVTYENWVNYLNMICGIPLSEENAEELFLIHTYLATLAKLIVWKVLDEVSFDSEQIVSVIEGGFFERQGIENFLEGDFFGWIVYAAARDTGVKIVRELLNVFGKCECEEFSGDALKLLYHELVGSEVRHGLGEVYTPDWLAHRMVRRLIQRNPRGSFLDPACGSGSFLYFVIEEKKNKLLIDKDRLLEHILKSVAGIDIHPLAVIMARTNYLLALGDLLKARCQGVSIPVYMFDSIRLPDERPQYHLGIKVPSLKVRLGERDFFFPDRLFQSPAFYDEVVDVVVEFVLQNIGKAILESDFVDFISARKLVWAEDEDFVAAIFCIAEVLMSLIGKGANSFWVWMLKNSGRSVFLKERFDFMIGNPPWVTFRSVMPGNQEFLKELAISHYNLLSGRSRGVLIPHLEVATLFLLCAADFYLRKRGVIAFILPKSIFNADQHDGLRQGKFRKVNLNFVEIWDCEKVRPLFSHPSCVLFAQKQSGAKISYPIPGQILIGKLERHDALLREAEGNLSVVDAKFYLHRRGSRSFWSVEESGVAVGEESFYKKYFREGATIAPRLCWFVEIKEIRDDMSVYVKSSEELRRSAAKTYRDFELAGNVEGNFLFATLLSKDILPFGHLDYRFVVLPIEHVNNGNRLINRDEAEDRGFVYLAEWLERVEELWNKKRGIKAEKISAIERLDYYRKLSSQDPCAKYRVLYIGRGGSVCACVREDRPVDLEINGRVIHIDKFIAESLTYCFETSDESEAFYLVAILNSFLVSRMVKSTNIYRDIHKRVFDLPIPHFNTLNDIHVSLAQLGRICSLKVEGWLKLVRQSGFKDISKLRLEVRRMLKDELCEIDTLVQRLLSLRCGALVY